MTTDPLDPTEATPDVAAVPEPTITPREAYENSVIRGEYNRDVAEADGRSPLDFERHRRGYLERIGGDRVTSVVVPQLLDQAARLEQQAGQGLDLSDGVNLGTIRDRVRVIAPTLRTDSPEGLYQGLMLLQNEPARLRMQARGLRDDANFQRQDARALLFRSAQPLPPSHPVALAISRLQGEIASLERQRLMRQPTLQAPADVDAMRRQIAAIERGELGLHCQSVWGGQYAGPPSFEQAKRYDEQWLENCKRQLAELLTLAKGSKAAEREDQRDRDELARLQSELREAESEREALLMVPEAMRFD